MKHLKTYENSKIEKYKKYVIIYCKIWSVKCYLIEVASENINRIYYYNFYYYDKANDKILSSQEPHKSSPLHFDKSDLYNSKIGFEILYQTDELEDGINELKNIMELETNQTKYNL